MNTGNIQEIIKTNFLFQFRTNNVLLDTVISGVIISAIGFIFGQVGQLQDNISRFFRWLFTPKGTKRKYEVELSRKEYNLSGSSYTYYEQNEKFDAVVKHLEKRFSEFEVNRVCQSQEGRGGDDLFLPEPGLEVKLENNLYLMITEGEETREGDEVGQSSRDLIAEKTITLYSPKRTPHEIMEWVDELEKAYTEEKKAKREEKRHFMNYIEKAEDELRFQLYDFSTTRSFQNVFFQGKQKLINHLDFFLNNKEWYLERGVARKVCYLFYGTPGCGKTSTIKAIAAYTGRHIINVNLAKIHTGKELFNIFFTESFIDTTGDWWEIPRDKRIYLLEDIDAMDELVVDRQAKFAAAESTEKKMQAMQAAQKAADDDDAEVVNKEDGEGEDAAVGADTKALNSWKEDPLTLSTLLNVLDGLLELSEQIVIMTSNFPEKLDKALVRPGRVDLHVKFTKCDDQMTREILGLFYDETPTKEEVPAFPHERWSPAEVCQICFQSKEMKEASKRILNEKPSTLPSAVPMAIPDEDDALVRCGSSAHGVL
eukprot:TRINITY_DN103155_c0_g1_i1.p1 TRINITY_DN103155_c0_g1~~TRINITY_DN103155_c0_g1_i1.p1  ORF type:complete len:540 (+),score=69.15 TRINITY_DN103155_c0_g1_i1:35-1654(+)